MPFFRTFIILVLTLFWGCAGVALESNPKTPVAIQTFEEDGYILLAFDALDRNDPRRAVEIFETLYKRSGSLEYLKEAIALNVAIGDYLKAREEALIYLEVEPKDMEVRRALIGVFASLNRLPEALAEARRLLGVEKSEENYELMASLYFVKQDYVEAEKYLESAYSLHQDEAILDRLTSTQVLFLKNRDKAIAYLESHSRIKGCSELVCEKLASLYREKQDLARLEETYKKLYEEFGEERYAKALLEVLLYRKEYDKAILFLERSGVEPEVLLDLYRFTGSLQKAQKQAEHLYAIKHDVTFLGLEAMLQYENAKNQNDPKLLETIESKLRIYLQERQDHVYLNFLGYLLIDHNVKVEEGIKLVEEALEQLPDSPHYRDSLAWGYYRLGECKRALSEMEKIPLSEIEAEEEMLEHYRLIQKCAKKSSK